MPRIERSAPPTTTTLPRSSSELPAATLATTPSPALPGYLPQLRRVDVEHLAARSANVGGSNVVAVSGGVVGAHVVAEVDTGVKGASGVCHLPGGETLVVDDDRGIALMVGDGTAQRLIKSGRDLEGICASADGRNVWVVQEATRRVERFDVERKDGRLVLSSDGTSKRLPKFRDIENKGWEGLAFLPSSLAPAGLGGGDHLVCVHEGSPRRIGIFALPDLDEGVTLKLPKAAKDLLPDLSDVAVDDRGHLFVLSDEGQCVVEFALSSSTRRLPGAVVDEPALTMLSSFTLPLPKKSKPEGLAFDDRGRLWVSLDTNGQALVLELQR